MEYSVHWWSAKAAKRILIRSCTITICRSTWSSCRIGSVSSGYPSLLLIITTMETTNPIAWSSTEERLPKHRGELTTNETMPLSLFSVEQVGQGFSKSCFKACIDFPVSTALPYTIKAKFVLANDFSSFSELIATFKSVEGLCILEKPRTVLGSH